MNFKYLLLILLNSFFSNSLSMDKDNERKVKQEKFEEQSEEIDNASQSTSQSIINNVNRGKLTKCQLFGSISGGTVFGIILGYLAQYTCRLVGMCPK